MQPSLKILGDYLKKNSFLIVLGEPLDVANLYLAVAMGLYLTKQGKAVTFYFSPTFNEHAKRYLLEVLEQYHLQYSEQIKDSNYVIAIDYRDGALDQVSYDTKDGKFLLYITPAPGADFNFENVQFKSGGNSFDAVMYFGKQWKGIPELIKQTPSLERLTERVYIDASPAGNQIKHGANWQQLSTEGLSVIEYLTTKTLDQNHFNKNTATLLLASALRVIDPLTSSDNTPGLSAVVRLLLQKEASLPVAFKSTYFYKDWQWLEINKQVYANLQVDHDAKVAWSIVDGAEEIRDYLRSKNFLYDAKLPLTLVHGVRLGFVVYYLGDGVAQVAIESDGSLHLPNLVPNFSYTGTNTKGVLEMRGADSQSITAILLEKAGISAKKPAVVLPKKAENAKIDETNITDESSKVEPKVIPTDQPVISVSRDLDDNLIEPPPVVPV